MVYVWWYVADGVWCLVDELDPDWQWGWPVRRRAVGLQGVGVTGLVCRLSSRRCAYYSLVVNGLVQISQAAGALRLPLRQCWATTPDTSDQFNVDVQPHTVTRRRRESPGKAPATAAAPESQAASPVCVRTRLTGIDRRSHATLAVGT